MRLFAAVRFTLAILLSTPVHAAAGGVQGDLAFAAGDYAAAFREWSAAAAAGDASAMAGLGALYDTGHGVPQDFAQALSWYRRAAEAGNVPAMLSTAAMYDSGRGTAVDRAEAIRWYGMAAEKGSGRAAYDLGVIYRDGDGVPRDSAAAVRFFRIAATAGVKAAYASLAALGEGNVPKSIATATGPSPPPMPPPPPRADEQMAEIGRFQEAALARSAPGTLSPRILRALTSALDRQARSGNALAEYDLGFAYEHGYGVPVDPVKSYVYYLKAAASRDATVNAAALKGAAEVGGRLTPEQHAAAREVLLDGPP